MPRSENSKRLKGNRRLEQKRAAIIHAKRWAKDHGLDPLDVMLDNMEDAHKRAQSFEGKVGKDAEQKRRTYRAMSQEAAKDAAPYVHPRLSSTTISGDKDAPVYIVDNIPRPKKG